MKNPVEWFLVMNEARARLVQGLPANGVAPAAELVIRADQRNLRVVMADKPGSSFSAPSAGRRSAMGSGTDPLLNDRLEFLSQTFALVEAHRRAGSFDRLVIVAGPRMLGRLWVSVSCRPPSVCDRDGFIGPC